MTDLLLVEDDPAIVSSLSDFLTQEGFTVTAASGQAAASRILETRRFHLALLDVTLGDGSGFSLCASIKAQYHIPVIFLTALADESSTVAGLELGGDDYIAKPFRPRELVSRIRTVLRRYRSGAAPLRLGPVQVDTTRGVATRDGPGPVSVPPGIPPAPPLLQQPRGGPQPEPDPGRDLGPGRGLCHRQHPDGLYQTPPGQD